MKLKWKEKQYYNKKGFSLIELLVTIVICLIVIVTLAKVYSTVIFSSKTQLSISESNLEKAIGLEILRKDLFFAGFGIPKNDKPLEWSPSHLTIYTTTANLDNNDALSWGYCINGTAVNLGEGNFISANQCNTLDKDFNSLNETCDCSSSSDFYFVFSHNGTKVEYFLDNSTLPQKCASGTYVLMRKDDSANIPLINCVAGFKIFIGIDLSGNNTLKWYNSSSSLNITDILKAREAIVYLLVQNGQKEKKQVTTNSTIDISYPISDNFTIPNKYYRWKLIKIETLLENIYKREI
ncbi:PilW family protein [Thermodesulfatator indicus]